MTALYLQEVDRASFERLLLSLDADSRRLRFSQQASDLCLIAYARTALVNANWMAGVFSNGRLRGAVEIYGNETLDFAEVALVVESGWRRRGVGSALLRAAAIRVGQSRVSRLRMVFGCSNLPMRALAAKAGARFEAAMSEIIATIDLG